MTRLLDRNLSRPQAAALYLLTVAGGVGALRAFDALVGAVLS